MKKIISLFLLLIWSALPACALAEGWDSAAVGDIVSFGQYEQGDGLASIQWIVLDKQEDRALLLANDALDAKPFHEVEDWDVTWADCTLRSWLNSDFWNSAFSDEERAQIVPVTNVTLNAPDTEDCVFLLSFQELTTYLPSEASRITWATDYAVAQGGKASRESGWWLRNKATPEDDAMMVRFDGKVYAFGYPMDTPSYTVRPAIWVSISESAS